MLQFQALCWPDPAASKGLPRKLSESQADKTACHPDPDRARSSCSPEVTVAASSSLISVVFLQHLPSSTSGWRAPVVWRESGPTKSDAATSPRAPNYYKYQNIWRRLLDAVEPRSHCPSIMKHCSNPSLKVLTAKPLASLMLSLPSVEVQERILGSASASSPCTTCSRSGETKLSSPSPVLAAGCQGPSLQAKIITLHDAEVQPASRT